MKSPNVRLDLPTYLDGLLDRWGVRRDSLSDSVVRRWVQRGLDAILAPYDLHTDTRLIQSRPRTFYAVDRLNRPQSEMRVDMLALLEAVYEKPTRKFEELALEAIRRGQPLGAPIGRVRPLPEQSLLARIVWADRSVFRELTNSEWPQRLFDRKYAMTDALAYCPDPDYRREFVARFRDVLNDRLVRRGLPLFWSYQATTTGFEGPDNPQSVFADLLDPKIHDMPAWQDRLLSVANTPAVQRRIAELESRGFRTKGRAKETAPRSALRQAAPCM